MLFPFQPKSSDINLGIFLSSRLVGHFLTIVRCHSYYVHADQHLKTLEALSIIYIFTNI